MKKFAVILCAAGLAFTASAGAQDAPAAPTAPAAQAPAARADHETECTGRVDEDGDGLVDCADSDCFHNPACESGHASEDSLAACSDWIDNDGDGQIDCDDQDCGSVARCQGSSQAAANTRRSYGGTTTPADTQTPDDMSELPQGVELEDVLGHGTDADGERTDEVCGDGLDNDGDGRIDCADYGCRFDPSVTVCATNPGSRFSAVVFGGASWEKTKHGDGSDPAALVDASFTRIQLRALGQLPFVQNSFYLLNARVENSFRLSFAMFQLPIGHGHYFNINSGGGGLTVQLIQSVARQPFGDPAYFVFNFVEQTSGVAAEVGGPLTSDSRLTYRAYVAGGAGKSTGSIGGRFFSADNQNFSYSGGAQLLANIVGRYDRFTSPMLYTPSPLEAAIHVGVRYDQRPDERYTAANVFAVLRYSRLHLSAESYVKREFVFDSWQGSLLVQANVLVLPRRFLLSAEFGQFLASTMKHLPTSAQSSVVKPVDQWQFRAAAHVYIVRNVFIGSLVFTEDHSQTNAASLGANVLDRIVSLEARFIF